jgi:hypothetical protein
LLFSDLPITLLLWLGAIGLGMSSVLAAVLLIAWLWGAIRVQGYVSIMLAIMFFGSILTADPAVPQPGSETFAANGPGFSVALCYEIGECDTAGSVKQLLTKHHLVEHIGRP